MRINVSGVRPEHTISDLEVDLDAGVEGLRRTVAERIGAAPERLRLIHMGRLIDDSRPLGSFLHEGATIHAVITQGAPPPSDSSSRGNNSGNNEQGGVPVMNLLEFANFWRGIPDPLLSFIQQSVSSMVGPTAGRTPVIIQGGIMGSGMGPHPMDNSQQQQQQQQQQREQEPQSQQQQQQQQQSPLEGQPQQQHRFSFSYAVPTPEALAPSPVHIHVHVSLDELEQLPERLERFRRRMQASGSTASVHVERGPLPHGATSSAQPAAPRTAESNNGNRGSDNNAPAGSRNLASNALPETIGELTNALIGTAEEEEESGLPQLCVIAFSNANVATLFPLLQGDFSFFAASRERLVEAVRQWGEQPEGEARRTQRENRRRFVEDQVAQAIEALQGNLSFMEFIERARRPQCNFLSELKSYLILAHEEIASAILNPTVDIDQWTTGLRVAFVRIAGIAAERASVWFEGGLSVLYELIPLMLQTMISQALNARTQWISQVIPMMRLSLTGFIPAWHAEYMSQHRRDTDSILFEEAAAAQEQRKEEDDLLDDCLDEFCTDRAEGGGNGTAANSHAGANTDEVRSALHAFRGASEEEEEDICRRARRFRYEERPANAFNASTMWKHLKKQ
ncbi:putative ubiquitin-like protein [Trypanosoma cruzi]|uniref:Ubiquitin-like protein, putative n=2 Tax=Trypanosoma cruzi TaxID=5693 RepID=Q4DGS4_TRYCC|nr:ubiquitin-like protein, putative [Trypanosoma cruzi]EAN91726.1 ubiquitin-like protein, putative [Trypanosoma cruzi]PWV14319.1 putative ubiquitin-like protein [Trypanosoma cruzi]RNC58706.1 putative ubiquitin-like protein [Trypanosoma cruzi]|eukprot:XP_813577.1 ubiquitin-like protein [Trypanosoma cruzi strain CL Brener]